MTIGRGGLMCVVHSERFARPRLALAAARTAGGVMSLTTDGPRSRSSVVLFVFLPFRFSPLHRKCPGVELPGNHQFVVDEDSRLDARLTILQLACVFGYWGLLLWVFTCGSTR
jgi:hypothetical protein